MYKNIIFDLGGVMVDFDPKTYLVDRFCNAEVEEQVSQLSNGACLGRADDLELDPATAQVKSLLLLGQPHLFGLLGRDETLVIPWTDIETLGVDAILVRTELPEPEAKKQGFWQKLRHWLDG